MTITITIKMDNEAFGEYPGPELARILRKFADDVEAEAVSLNNQRLWDINGNTVGAVKVKGG